MEIAYDLDPSFRFILTPSSGEVSPQGGWFVSNDPHKSDQGVG